MAPRTILENESCFMLLQSALCLGSRVATVGLVAATFTKDFPESRPPHAHSEGGSLGSPNPVTSWHDQGYPFAPLALGHSQREASL